MNRRIQKKIAKRIINKIGTENILTDFERKYFIKFFWKPLRKEVTSIVEELKVEELTKEKIEELSIAEETAVEQAEIFKSMDYSEEQTIGVLGNTVVEITEEERFQSAIDAMNNFGKHMNPEPPAPVEEPSKWNKLKGKMKGWFGK